jgi:hypothetical protein
MIFSDVLHVPRSQSPPRSSDSTSHKLLDTRDLEGRSHTVQGTASTLFEAIDLVLKAIGTDKVEDTR